MKIYRCLTILPLEMFLLLYDFFKSADNGHGMMTLSDQTTRTRHDIVGLKFKTNF